jgi:hypothetical protein
VLKKTKTYSNKPENLNLEKYKKLLLNKLSGFCSWLQDSVEELHEQKLEITGFNMEEFGKNDVSTRTSKK